MNSVLNINVRVAAAQAKQAISQVEGQIKSLQKTAAAGAGGGGLFGGAWPKHLDRFGKQLQWTGRQLEFNFTLPLLLAGAAATKWSLDNQRAMVQVQKVYGDGTESAGQLRGELDALTRTFELLSSRFGQNQREVIEIAGAWAQAGSAGVGLARATRLTLETMILGQLDAQKATEGLIGIQSAFALSTEQLTAVVADLNRIENQTGITLGGLIDVLARAGGVAKTAGIPVQQLAAYAAALVPAAGSASQAGNALRTMISRIMSPTKEAGELMARMGVDIFSATWQAESGAGRIKILADAFMGLDDAQKTAVSTAVASRWQINRFDLLMEQVSGNTGMFGRAMDTVRDSMGKLTGSTKAQLQMQNELRTALGSDPQKFSILWNTLKNTAAAAIQPIIPYLIILVQKIVNLVSGFKNLSPEVKMAVAAGLLFLAVLGPLARYVGAVALLFGTMGQAAGFLYRHLIGSAAGAGFFTKTWTKMWFVIKDVTTTMYLATLIQMDKISAAIRASWAASSTFIARIWGGMWRVVSTVLGPVGRVLVAGVAAIGAAMNKVWAASIGAMALPPGAMVALVIGMFVLLIAWVEEHVPGGFHQMVKNIGNALAQLPRLVASVFKAIGRAIMGSLRAIRDAINNALNPFARHSPSLVDNVVAGVEVILNQYERLKAIPGMLRGALETLENFKNVAGDRGAEFEFQQQRADIVEMFPGSGESVDRLWASIKLLKVQLAAVNVEVQKQQAIVDTWERSLDEANRTLKQSEFLLDQLQTTARQASDALSLAKEELDRFKNIELSGWYAMDDAIFENEMAINRLRLAILKMEDAGLSVDDMKNKLSQLAGEIEMLRGEAADLRNAGAGSDVLGPLEDQIALLEQQRTEIQNQSSPISDLQKQLEDLERKGQILDLEKSLQFDPLRRQIDRIGLSMEELPFDQLFAQISAQAGVVKELEEAWKAADAAVTAQQAVVDQHKAARDAIQASYDLEKDKLGELKDAYSAVEDAIREMENALRETASTAGQMLQAIKDTRSQAEKLFDAGEGFNFEDVGGVTGIGREGGLLDIEAFNKQMEEELAKALRGMDIKIDLFKPIKDQFVKVWDWIKRNSTKLILGAMAGIGLAVLLGITGIPALMFTVFMAGLTAIFGDKIAQWFRDRLGDLGDIAKWAVEKVVDFFQWLYDVLIGNSLIPDLVNGIVDWFKRLPGMLLDALGDAGKWLLRTGAAIVEGLVDGIAKTLGRVWSIIGEIAKGIGRIVAGAARWLWNTGIDIIRGLVEGLGSVLRWVWDFISGIPRGIWQIVSTAARWLWNTGIEIISGLVGGLASVLGWVWDLITSIPSGIWRIVSNAARWLWNTGIEVISGLLGGLGSMFGRIWEFINAIPTGIWKLVSGAGEWLFNTGKSIIIGLWNGFASWIGNFWSRISSFGSDVVGFFGKIFRLGSPSKLFAEIGSALGQGLVNGMLSETDKVAHAAQVLANAAIPEVGNINLPTVSMGGMSMGTMTGSTYGNGSSSINSTTNSKREVHIHGNLEFPNITDGADAEAFVRNLSALAD